ncbi:peptidylglycine alpha-hydroxylating monooxygenase [Myzus persicae]|uniref:peptidylglycine alpha-hydroxylating monooxygenase n=1 Tax=Myzus persicae TaxID=13164 RepID=UPI000B937176|nr:peptidylglycine alpha-hydroxylating monooxygenase [Myzus persicae]XP_022176832.1 peptidylglycine alpha-hydroxylating monooxygenase [Myzus persicae]XP_022176833.1 peptidylglycine alpha-hydroxylating monooxygenase [Myzus persicae]XP_022176834.1 peptidylglycine alpha-hydroxylating monooxygenase [Myzus persicae]
MSSVAYSRSLVSLVVVVVVATIWPSAESYSVDKYSLLMPNVRPKKMDLYLCTPIRIDPSKSYFIVGFEPKAHGHTSHHMLLYGCSEPGSEDPVWNCGEMQMASNKHKTYMHSNPCKSGSNIMYAWARDAPTLKLPNGVGFKVGGDSQINYLVLQVHYHRMFEDDETDNSGIYLHYTEQQLDKQAGVYLLATNGRVPPNAIEHMETSCPLFEIGKVIHPFAYRVHTHELGKVVSGYRVKNINKEVQKWDLLGKRDPMTPQMFYPIENNITVESGDILAARCTMESRRNTVTRIGATSDDEMCNFYVMYWVEGTEPLEQQLCVSEGPPRYYWDTDPYLTNIPDEEASIL